MGYSCGHARVNARKPQAHAICDRCGFRYNHVDLQWQFQWQGPTLQNLRQLVCRSCLDVPNAQLRTILIPADPLPILNPRPELYDQFVPSAMSTVQGVWFVTSSGSPIVMSIRITPEPVPPGYLDP